MFVTFEESAEDIRQNMRSFGWDLAAWERDGKLAFVDASPDPDVGSIQSGSFDLGALLARIQNAVQQGQRETRFGGLTGRHLFAVL